MRGGGQTSSFRGVPLNEVIILGVLETEQFAVSHMHSMFLKNSIRLAKFWAGDFLSCVADFFLLCQSIPCSSFLPHFHPKKAYMPTLPDTALISCSPVRNTKSPR